MSEVKYFRPRSYGDLVNLLGQLPDDFQTVAGTTDFIPTTRKGAPYPEALVDVSSLAEFKEIQKVDNTIRIGAAVTMAELLGNDIIIKSCPVLASAAKSLGNGQTRNRATIGGNIANASPGSDTAPVLLTLNANVHFVRKDGSTRQIPLTDFYLDYQKTARQKDEIITGFSFEIPPPGTWSRFAKVGLRDGTACSVVNMSILVQKNADECVELAVSFGAVGPIPLRSKSLEATAKGKTFNSEFLAECAKAVQQDISPISDIRGSAEYRREVAANILVRALTDAFA